jgi:hypothetical protein
MALVDVISKETEREIVTALRQITATAKAAETLLTNLEADRARIALRLERLTASVKDAL